MKKLLLIFVIAIVFASCGESSSGYKYNTWYLNIVNDNGWSTSNVECDSLTMISRNEAIIYNNGRSSKIYGEELKPIYIRK
jgi:hypothetical protein